MQPGCWPSPLYLTPLSSITLSGRGVGGGVEGKGEKRDGGGGGGGGGGRGGGGCRG